jgi:hypothetical protein
MSSKSADEQPFGAIEAQHGKLPRWAELKKE